WGRRKRSTTSTPRRAHVAWRRSASASPSRGGSTRTSRPPVRASSSAGRAAERLGLALPGPGNREVTLEERGDGRRARRLVDLRLAAVVEAEHVDAAAALEPAEAGGGRGERRLDVLHARIRLLHRRAGEQPVVGRERVGDR